MNLSHLPEVQKAHAAGGPAPSEPAAPLEVLVVDDHALIRKGFQLLLSSLARPCRGTFVGSVEAAVEAVQQHGPFGIAMLDLGLPGCSGLQALDRFIARCPGTPVVVVSATVTRPIVIGALERGARGYIGKHLDLDECELEAAVRDVLERSLIYLPQGLFPPEEGRASTAPVPELLLPESDEPAEEHEDPADEGVGAVFGLTRREAEVFVRIGNGHETKLIARDLGIGEKAVKRHITNIFRKAGVKSRPKLLVLMHQRGISVPIIPAPAPLVRPGH